MSVYSVIVGRKSGLSPS